MLHQNKHDEYNEWELRVVEYTNNCPTFGVYLEYDLNDIENNDIHRKIKGGVQID